MPMIPKVGFTPSISRHIPKVEWARITSKRYYCRQCDTQKYFFNGTCTTCGYTFPKDAKDNRFVFHCAICARTENGSKKVVAAYRVGKFGFCYGHKDIAILARKNSYKKYVTPKDSSRDKEADSIDRYRRGIDGISSLRRASRNRLK
jgi:hypothetical protein